MYVAFRLSERGDVVGRIAARERRRWRSVESFSVRAGAGRNSARVPTDGPRPGTYRLELVAYDAADRRSNEAKVRFTIGRR